MNSLRIRHLSVFVILLAFAGTSGARNPHRPVQKDGTLVVRVTWGDVSHTPANDVYVEAHGFVHEYHSEKSFVLTSSKAGRYELSLPPAVYDVFVSEGGSDPRCRRVRVRAGVRTTWSLRLKIDEVYTAG